MAMSSDEQRREVARNLRNGGIARNSEEAYVLLLSRVGIRPQLPATSTYKDAMTRLADLIDPTCQNDGDEWRFLCSKCGELVSITKEVPCGHGEAPYIPYYCPSCGARVVDCHE